MDPFQRILISSWAILFIARMLQKKIKLELIYYHVDEKQTRTPVKYVCRGVEKKLIANKNRPRINIRST